jgi:hypothetical protein
LHVAELDCVPHVSRERLRGGLEDTIATAISSREPTS